LELFRSDTGSVSLSQHRLSQVEEATQSVTSGDSKGLRFLSNGAARSDDG